MILMCFEVMERKLYKAHQEVLYIISLVLWCAAVADLSVDQWDDLCSPGRFALDIC